MDDKKFEIILNSLLDRTRKNELNWKTTANVSKYLLVLTDSSIVINQDLDLLGDIFYEFKFKNEKGATVESVDIYSENNKDSFMKSSELYNMISRKVLNSDETIDKIIRQLNPESLAA